MDSTGASDYYSRLEVARGAPRGDIVDAYRRLAMGVHPDSHPEDPHAAARFREIAEAYEVLGDPQRRAAYDRQLGGARIQVQVHHASRGNATVAREGPWRHHAGDPVVLRTSRPQRRGISSGIWPVSNEYDGRQAHDVATADRWVSAVSDLLRRVAESWWEL